MFTTQQLVEQYVPLANKLAYQKKRVLPKFIDIEELKSAAYLGLVEAASRFDQGLGIAFSTFAYPRIFGAIHDYLREQGWMKRGDNSKMLSLDVPSSDGEDCMLRDLVESKPDGDVEECFEAITIKLDHQAKQVLRCYFIDEYSMKEVGEKFDVSESRISQLIKQYKKRIEEDWSLDSYLELAA
jgi:RNA polymerase sigma factor (sigma-70 family)